jgi:hypothetical protein
MILPNEPLGVRRRMRSAPYRANRGPDLLAPAHVTAFAEGEVRDAAAPDLQCAPR